MCKDPLVAEKYVRKKQNLELTNAYIQKLSKQPLDESRKKQLLSFLKNSSPNQTDFAQTINDIPHDLPLNVFHKYLRDSLICRESNTKNQLLRKWISGNNLLDLRSKKFDTCKTAVDITESTICMNCKNLIGKQPFIVTEELKIFHLS